MRKKKGSRLDPYFGEIKNLREKGLSTVAITILINEKLEKKMKYHSIRRFMDVNHLLRLGKDISRTIY